jgi:hypothetical protein
MMTAVTGQVRLWLRLEGLALLLACLWAFELWGQVLGWKLFVALFLLPDVALLAYLLNARLGAALYNATHNQVFPLLLLALSLQRSDWGVALSLMWLAHIGFDRALGFGLKYETSFYDTHLGRVHTISGGANE